MCRQTTETLPSDQQQMVAEVGRSNRRIFQHLLVERVWTFPAFQKTSFQKKPPWPGSKECSYLSVTSFRHTSNQHRLTLPLNEYVAVGNFSNDTHAKRHLVPPLAQVILTIDLDRWETSCRV